MLKPQGYDEVVASGEYEPIELGGHHCIIKKVEETQSKNGNDMIVVYFDFAPNDKQPNYFQNDYNNDTREDKKWPFAGRKYIMVQDYQDRNKVSRQFKTFCSCVEKSNPKFVIQWGNDWGRQFVNARIGVVYGAEQEEYDGNIRMRHLPRFFCETSKALDAKVPAAKMLPEEQKRNVMGDQNYNNMYNRKDSFEKINKDIPF